LLLLGACASKPSPEWIDLKAEIRERFPGVSQVSTTELRDRMQREQDVLLLDARAGEEYAVSHLAGARPAPTESEALRVLDGVAKDRRIVAYCSVGYRSSDLAQKLGARGFTNVHNLEGSIFEWANAGYPLYRGDERVREVHPFDAHWGRLLERDLWSPPAKAEPDQTQGE
jgi:rhodanese-related sulfurtransferase